ncbi:hypothetical protein EW145_g6331 [Phellinidium pouzarii]|uniref:Secreted protein n=1 Tax=Phellinidium pouzarii TaxID=167371 RepID=A0A4S4KYR3_9AGAM|nr:hypothetical protein EW145_g6331 [Phellinidium pouzarii]
MDVALIFLGVLRSCSIAVTARPSAAAAVLSRPSVNKQQTPGSVSTSISPSPSSPESMCLSLHCIKALALLTILRYRIPATFNQI